MFREMSRKDLQLDDAAALSVLEQSLYGVLAVVGDNGYPYAVPLSYAYESGKIYVHGKKEGHKIDALTANPKVSFCIVGEATLKSAQLTFAYTTIIIFGTARVLEGDDEKRAAIERTLRKYSADYWDKGQRVIQNMWDKFTAFEIPIEHMTGKQRR